VDKLRGRHISPDNVRIPVVEDFTMAMEKEETYQHFDNVVRKGLYHIRTAVYAGHSSENPIENSVLYVFQVKTSLQTSPETA